MAFQWVKTWHIIFVIAWYAGLFYLPRIYVNLAMVPADSTAERERLLLMARKLYRFMNILMWPAVVLGLILWLYYGVGLHGPGNGWIHLKVALVVLLIGYQHWCKRILRQFEQGRNTRSHKWYRWFNEIPTLILFIIIPLVVIKPF
ncbi:CopD family protein [Thiomonas sp.]|jgi:putative membrane protein|uniref:CopD family protein n=1 Tax=Thiomonas sp. TaxID=2047785 RepID=UPI0026206C53|nr:CopD family protein [Thiomonas sp.]